MTIITEQQIKALEDMISRRMENTGESRKEASQHITNYLAKR